MGIIWSSEETHGEYPPYWGGPYSHTFTDTEELIIERARDKIIELRKKEKLMPRERAKRAFITEEEIDRIPFFAVTVYYHMGRVFDGFAAPDTPPSISQKDIIWHPNLGALATLLYNARFPGDILGIHTITFGEEYLSRKFRFIEHGPPLVVEPFIKTKEDADFLLENPLDPTISGSFAAHLWIVKQMVKIMGPTMPILGSTCSGPSAGSGFARGIREICMDVRKNPEMATAVFRAVTNWQNLRADRMMEVLGTPFAPGTEDKGNILFTCDSTDYFRAEEFKKYMEHHYGWFISHCAKKGWPLALWPTPAPGTLEALLECLKENIGYGINLGTEHPPVEYGYPIMVKYGLPVRAMNCNEAIVCKGPAEAIEKEVKRLLAQATKDMKGIHTLIAGCGDTDAMNSAENLDLMFKYLLEYGKYPVEVTV